jgi:hypothetical protein
MSNTHKSYDFTHFCYPSFRFAKTDIQSVQSHSIDSKKFKHERLLFKFFRQLCQKLNWNHTWVTRWFPMKLSWTWCKESNRFKAISGWRGCWSRCSANNCWNWFVELCFLMLVAWPSFLFSFFTVNELCLFKSNFSIWAPILLLKQIWFF